MYRDDLEAAQARADALEREARTQKERAEDAEREAEELREKNAQLEAAAEAASVDASAGLVREGSKPRESPPPPGVTAARMRRSVIGWSLMAIAVAAMFIVEPTGFGFVGYGVAMVVLCVGIVLA